MFCYKEELTETVPMRRATTGVDICCELDNSLKKKKNFHLTSSCEL